MKRFLAAAGGLALAALVAPSAWAIDLPFSLTSTPILVLQDIQSGIRTRLHLENLNMVGAGYSAYCSFTLNGLSRPAQASNYTPAGGGGTLAVPALPVLAPRAPGSFEVAPGRPVDFSQSIMPSGDLWCVGDQGSTGSGPAIPFTVSVIQNGY